MSFIIVPPTQDQIEAKAKYFEDNKDFFEAMRVYSGRNYFLKDMVRMVDRGVKLTDNQMAAAKRVVEGLTRRVLEGQGEVVTTKDTSQAILAVGDIVTVNNPMAVKIGIAAGFNKKFHNIEILEVLDEKFGVATVRAVTCYKKVSNCGCCGLTLTDPESIALGIGPVCGRRRGVKTLEDLDRALGKAEVTLRLPRAAIKNVFKFNQTEEGVA